MKKIIKVFICTLLVIFGFVLFMNHNDEYYINKLKKNIIDNTELKEISYINYYDGYYIVMDNSFLYLYDNEYKELLSEDQILIHENSNNYDIIYKDNKFIYFSDKIEDNQLIYQYYNLYNYELIDEVLVGGKK